MVSSLLASHLGCCESSGFAPCLWPLYCGLLLSLVLCCNISAETYAGSLLSGCSLHVTFCAINNYSGSECCHFCCAKRVIWELPQLWHLGGPSSGPGALGSIRRETLGPGLGFIGAAFEELLANFGQAYVFFKLVSRSLFFMISGFEFGIWTSAVPES